MNNKNTLQANQVAVIQMNTQADIEANLHQANHLLAEAAQQGAKLALLPEVFACYDSSKYLALAQQEKDNSGRIRHLLSQWAKTYQLTIIAGTIPAPVKDSPEKVYARCYVINSQGEEIAHYDKIHLFDVDLPDKQKSYRESNLFQAGDQIVTVDTEVGRVGLAICYDLRFANLFAELREKEADIFVLPSAFTYTTGLAHWQPLLRARAIEQQCYVLAANQCGWHDEKRQTYGHSMVIDPWGEIVSELDEQVGIACADIDLAKLKQVRQQMPVLEHKKLGIKD